MRRSTKILLGVIALLLLVLCYLPAISQILIGGGSGVIGGTTGTGAGSVAGFYGRQYLQDWDARISGMEGAVDATPAPAVVAYIGDSWLSGSKNWCELTFQKMSTNLSHAGAGFISANAGVDISPFATRTFGGSGWSTDTPHLGPDGQSATDSTPNDYINFAGNFTSYNIYYQIQTGGGQFTYKVDSDTISAAIDTSVGGVAGTMRVISVTTLHDGSTPISDAIHTLNVTVSSAGTAGVRIFGVELIRSHIGVRINKLGCGGSTTANWAGNTDLQAALTAMAPNLVIVSLGVNDAASVSVGTYRTNLQSIVTTILAAVPNASIILASQSDIGPYPGVIAQYSAQMKQVAQANNLGYIDFATLVGGYTGANARGLYTNSSHIGTAGHWLFYHYLLNYLYAFDPELYNGWTSTNLNIGQYTGGVITTGLQNTHVGARSGMKITTGCQNTGFGAGANFSQVSGYYNVAVGSNAQTGSSGTENVSIGTGAGIGLTSGSNNIFVGMSAGGNHTTQSNRLCISSYDSYASQASEQTNAILYGTMASTANPQTLNVNAGTLAQGGGTTGGLATVCVEATATLPTSGTGATTITLNIPKGVKILSAQLRVDAAVTGATALTAAFTNTTTTAITDNGNPTATGSSTLGVTKSSAMNNLRTVSELTTGTANISVTPTGTYSGTAGVVRAIVYYQTLATIAAAP